MKNKALSLILASSMAAAVFTGCGNNNTALSAAQIADGAADALENAKSVSSRLTIDLTGNFSDGDETEVSMLLGCDIESVSDPVSAHITENMTMSYAGESTEQQLEFYIVHEDGKLYSYTGSGDMWVRTESSDADTGSTTDTIFREIADGNLEASLANETETLENGREVYSLGIPVTGNYLDRIIDFSVDGEGGLFGSIDYSDMIMDTVIYIYKDNLEPALIDISCPELGQAMFEQLLGFSGIDIAVENFSIECEYTDFNGIDEITVPDDVKAAAASSSDTNENTSEEEQTGQSAESGSQEAENLAGAEESIINSEEIIYDSATGVLNFDPAITIDSTEFVLPLSYTALISDGWTADDSSAGSVYANDYDLVHMHKGDTTITAYIYNPDSSDKEYSECTVIGIDVVSSDAADSDISLSPGVMLSSSTLTDVLDTYGKPTNYYTEDSMIYLGYVSSDFSNIINLYFDSGSQTLIEIDIQQQPSASGLLSP